MLEAARDNGGFSTVQVPSITVTSGSNTSVKGKSKRKFTTLNVSDPESEDEETTSAHVVTGNSSQALLTNSRAHFNIMIMKLPLVQISFPLSLRITGSKSPGDASVIPS